MFYHYLKEHFYKNYDEILAFVENKKDIIETHNISIYSMQTTINYNKLKDKLIETKDCLNL